jgi:hypothetical protein
VTYSTIFFYHLIKIDTNPDTRIYQETRKGNHEKSHQDFASQQKKGMYLFSDPGGHYYPLDRFQEKLKEIIEDRQTGSYSFRPRG